ncbi:hypothetical protein [Rhodoplanes roseus]|uniref:Uncharacterized protein n=1 Tax=Rhodoplanes roseus TaxID=29409 RepID=A0A327L4U2_9BRAD|nr:hypothetical protein [Rhodoplanes roseus]RAI45426.1 hypothetical protein CH341_04085 [Rhodoplanes roseus]
MYTRTIIAGLVYMMVQAVLFGVGTVIIASTPLANDARTLMPWHVVLSFLVAVPIAWWLAPRLQARYWRRRDARVASGVEQPYDTRPERV